MFILKVENTEKAGHDVKPRLPVKMCTLTSVVRSQHAIDCKEKGSVYHVYHVPVLVNTIRPLELVDVFIQRTGFVFYRTLLLPRAHACARGRAFVWLAFVFVTLSSLSSGT